MEESLWPVNGTFLEDAMFYYDPPRPMTLEGRRQCHQRHQPVVKSGTWRQ